ncbi:MAG TPA: asparagine synthase (glutamine-hydrolyzing) [Methanobacterium sp.]|nr:asparagine synthase (glutamine-hydrolyzing) [Methanobacterium sp.]
MCAICGIQGKEVSRNLQSMLKTLKHRGPDGCGVFVDGEFSYGNVDEITVPEGSFGLGHNLLSIVGSEGLQPLHNHGLVLICNGEIYNYHELEKEFKVDLQSDSDCETIIALIHKFYRGSLYTAVSETIKHLDGDYAFAVYDGKNTAVIRDPLGVKPVYYGLDPDKNISAFASERKALWKIGMGEIKTLPPGCMLYNWKIKKLDYNLKTILQNHDSRTLQNHDSRTNMEDKKISDNTYKNYLKNELKTSLIESVKKRVRGLSEVGVMFSGGVDSTILAQLSHDLGVETTLYSVGHEDSDDFKFAQKSAEDMGLPIRLQKVTVEDVRNYLPPVLNAIEEFNLMKLGVGMPAYIAAEMAKFDGIRVMLSGQGADELFAGYHRYLEFYQNMGEDAIEHLKEDIFNLYRVNLQRDDQATMAHGVELRVPYLDVDVINMAIDIPMKYKITGSSDLLRKRILREVAQEMGVPLMNVKRPKKAAQYGSGIDKMIRRILRQEKIDYRKF